MGFLSLIFGCKPAQPALPEILSETEEGFSDMVFRINKYEKQANGETVIETQSMAQNKIVGFRIRLNPNWKEGKLGDSLTTYQGQVIIERCGIESDELLRFMELAYKTQISPLGMKESVRFTGISLQGKPHDLDSGPVKIKLFYESENENEYAELYLNIDTARRKAWLNEKDPEYRTPIIKDLGRK